jgi:hypothetical protein
MRPSLKLVGLAASVALVLVACGIKGAPKPPVPPPAPPTETQPPPQDPGRGPIEPSGPTIAPGVDGGTVIPGTETP